MNNLKISYERGMLTLNFVFPKHLFIFVILPQIKDAPEIYLFKNYSKFSRRTEFEFVYDVNI